MRSVPVHDIGTDVLHDFGRTDARPSRPAAAGSTVLRGMWADVLHESRVLAWVRRCQLATAAAGPRLTAYMASLAERDFDDAQHGLQRHAAEALARVTDAVQAAMAAERTGTFGDAAAWLADRQLAGAWPAGPRAEEVWDGLPAPHTDSTAWIYDLLFVDSLDLSAELPPDVDGVRLVAPRPESTSLADDPDEGDALWGHLCWLCTAAWLKRTRFRRMAPIRSPVLCPCSNAAALELNYSNSR